MTPLSDFHDFIRAVLGDEDPDVHIYEADILNKQMGVVLVTGKVDGYSLANDRENITPELPLTDTKACAQLIYYTAKRFAVLLTRESFRQRAFAWSKGAQQELVWDILEEIGGLEEDHVGTG